MRYANSNPLLRSWLVVILFWWTVLFFITDASFDEYLPSLGRAIYVVLVGLICGAAIHLIYHYWKIGNALWFINGETRHGAVVSLGRLPEAPDLLPKQPRRWWPFGRKAASPSDYLPWFGLYESRHPDYAAAFRAVFDALAANPDHPATVAERGHADLSLFAHSIGVVEAMMAVAPSWQYYGRRKRNGEITIPLSDPTLPFHAFARDDPLLPLAALAHDIGKLISYQKGEDGQFIEVRPTHGPDGAKVLRGMPAVSQIPFADSTALIFAVKFYHHPGQMPQSAWITDRMRSLTELLLHADIEASRREGRISPTHLTAECADASPDELESVTLPPVSASMAPSPNVAATLGAAAIEPDPIDLAADILKNPNRVNGSNARQRVGFKFGDWLYIDEESLRRALSESTNKDQYLATRAPGASGLHSYTRSLLERLHAQGMLRCPDGPFSPETALYRTRNLVPGKPPKVRVGVFVVLTEAFPFTKNIPDCLACPEIIAAGPLAVAEHPARDASSVSRVPLAADTNHPVDDSVKASVYRAICHGILSKHIDCLVRLHDGTVVAIIPAHNLTILVPGFDQDNPPKGVRIMRNTRGVMQAVLPYPAPEDAAPGS